MVQGLTGESMLYTSGKTFGGNARNFFFYHRYATTWVKPAGLYRIF
jgi:hypothetical protein